MDNKDKKNDDLFDELFNEDVSDITEQSKELDESKELDKNDELDKTETFDENQKLGEELEEPFSSNKLNVEDDRYTPSTRKKRQKTRQARITMTPKEYRQELKRLNEGAENKHYIFLFGVAGAGKSYIIASLLHYMTNYLKGNTRLNRDVATERESLLYNQMLEMFSNPDKNVARTDISNFYELNIIYKPETVEKPPLEITFIDASGEHIERIYHGEGSEQAGELPDYLEVILESKVNCKFIFVYDQSLMDSTENSIKGSQAMILKSLYDKVRAMQERYDYSNKIYPKVLLLSKADKISEKVKQQYGESATRYAKAQENELSTFSNGFFSEPDNRAIFYRMGTFTKHDDLDEFDATCPEKLFNWLYGTVNIGQSIIPKENCFQRFKKWFLGH